MPIDAVPDHVAIAVPRVETASRRWVDQLGGRWIGPEKDLADPERQFDARQFRFANGALLEMLAPMRDDSFLAGFLARYGPRVHHMTFRVPALQPVLDEVRGAGYDVVDVSMDDEYWHEGFLRPSQVGGMIVQVVWMGRTEEDIARMQGFQPEPPPADGARLLGPTLTHPDLDEAERLWGLLGGTLEAAGGTLRVTWPDSPLSVHLEQGADRGPVGLRIAEGPSLPADPELGPATLPG